MNAILNVVKRFMRIGKMGRDKTKLRERKRNKINK